MTNKPQEERRVLGAQESEVRKKDGDGSGATIVGYAAVFGQEANIGGYFREIVERGAFTEALKNSDIHALFNHEYSSVLGRAKSGTLRLKEDDRGLYFEIDLPDTQDARDLVVKMERGDIDESSFQFSMRNGIEEWDESGDTPLRTIKKIGEMFDVSVCPRGAYPTTECGLRNLENFRKQRNFSGAARRLRMKGDLDLKGRE